MIKKTIVIYQKKCAGQANTEFNKPQAKRSDGLVLVQKQTALRTQNDSNVKY